MENSMNNYSGMSKKETGSLSEKTIRGLIRQANQARDNAYTPYSHYRVGAALLCADGDVVKGCNIENASYGATNCAERTAVFAAVAQGKRAFTALALVAGPEEEMTGDGQQGQEEVRYPSPCGICRQVLREFVSPKDFVIIMAKSETDYRIRTLEELLPESFGLEDLA